MLQMYCEACETHTPHEDGLCTVCAPVERTLTLLRECGPEVADGDYANELDDDPQPGNCR